VAGFLCLVGNRVEDFLFEKIEKKRPNRLSNLEYLGLDMIEAGNEFGPGTAYGMLWTLCSNCILVISSSLLKRMGKGTIMVVEVCRRKIFTVATDMYFSH
jgi:hypothetical protein